ncbi:MAG: hypothetical protein FJY73_09185 [Candidatus Eisenbacteria bacterium]|nr:hypothetical protein [Candidatus Eisenbacteria bacterium]
MQRRQRGRGTRRCGLAAVLLFLVCVLAGSASSSFLGTSLDSLTSDADFIVLGKTVAVANIEGVPVAHIKVLKTLKGLEFPELFYLARTTWTCDISGAQLGEKALFFFARYQYDPNAGYAHSPPDSLALILPGGDTVTVRDPLAPPVGHPIDFKEPLGFKEKIRAILGDSPFLRIAHSGRGRMPVQVIDRTEYVDVFDGVWLPKKVRTIRPRSWKDPDGRLVPLGVILKMIEKQLRAGPGGNNPLSDSDELCEFWWNSGESWGHHTESRL